MLECRPIANELPNVVMHDLTCVILYVLPGLDEKFMGRLYIPKPPDKRTNWICKSMIIARAV